MTCAVKPHVDELRDVEQEEFNPALLICQSEGDPVPEMTFHKVGLEQPYTSGSNVSIFEYARRLNDKLLLFRNSLMRRYISGRSKTSRWTERGVLPTLPRLRQPVRPESERRTAVTQTVPTTASVEAKTSTVIKKRLFFNEFLNSNSSVSTSRRFRFIHNMVILW